AGVAQISCCLSSRPSAHSNVPPGGGKRSDVAPAGFVSAITDCLRRLLLSKANERFVGAPLDELAGGIGGALRQAQLVALDLHARVDPHRTAGQARSGAAGLGIVRPGE